MSNIFRYIYFTKFNRMNRNEIDNIINYRNSLVSQLNKLFYEINLCKDTSQNEYKRLSEKVLIQLEKGIECEKMKLILESELIVGYGLFNHEFDSEQLTNTIFNWWESN